MASKIIIIQSDNRPYLDYLLLTQEVNKKACNHLNYHYLFIKIDDEKYCDIHPATKKIYVVNDFLHSTNENDILVFLDSDAWIQNPSWLKDIIDELINNNDKHGCFSRDPYINKNTFINSGSFILKINEFTKKMYSEIIFHLENIDSDSYYKNNWPFDQFYISNYVFQNKDSFNIFIPHTLNTPVGEVLRHNWWKNQKMINDLYQLIQEPITRNMKAFDFEKYYDKENYPNENEYGNEYFV